MQKAFALESISIFRVSNKVCFCLFFFVFMSNFPLLTFALSWRCFCSGQVCVREKWLLLNIQKVPPDRLGLHCVEGEGGLVAASYGHELGSIWETMAASRVLGGLPWFLFLSPC